MRWRFIDNTLTSTVNNEGKEEDKFTLDPKSNPKAIDLTDKNAHRTPGIYTLEGDTLKTCFDEGSDERPKRSPPSPILIWWFSSSSVNGADGVW